MRRLRRIVGTSTLVMVVVTTSLGVTSSHALAAASSGHRSTSARSSASTRRAATDSPPGSPFIEQVIAEGLSVIVNWAPNPSSDDVTGYKLRASVASGFAGKPSKTSAAPPAASAPSTDSSALMAKLCSGVPYVVTMTASNAAGTSTKSAPSNPAVPLVAQPPSAPLITAVLSRSSGLVVNWSAPSIGGGDPLTGYVLTTTAGSSTVTTNATATATQLTLAGLTNGTTYTLSLVATSDAGTSAPGTSIGTPATATPPEGPESLQVVPDGTGNLVATWSDPADPGSSAITGYTVTTQAETESSGVWSPTGSLVTQTLGPTATTVTIGGLSATSFYSVSVAATSAAGTGPPATTVNPITPTVQLATSTVVLTQATMDALTSDAGSTLTWDAPAPSQVTSLATGNVLVGPISTAAPNGLLATVTQVTDSSGTYTVAIATASLSDAFSNVSFGFSGDPLAEPGSTFQAKSPGVRTLVRNSSVNLTLGHTLLSTRVGARSRCPERWT